MTQALPHVSAGLNNFYSVTVSKVAIGTTTITFAAGNAQAVTVHLHSHTGPAPAISALSSHARPAAGGSTLAIRGTNFRRVTSVYIGARRDERPHRLQGFPCHILAMTRLPRHTLSPSPGPCSHSTRTIFRAALTAFQQKEEAAQNGDSAHAALPPSLNGSWLVTPRCRHAPLQAHIRALALRARIPLQARPATSHNPPPAEVPAPYGLTGRELDVLRVLAAGRTNAQIGAELYISPKTVSVHVTSIFRKLGVSGRVQAAAWPRGPGCSALRPKDAARESKDSPGPIRGDHLIRAALP